MKETPLDRIDTDDLAEPRSATIDPARRDAALEAATPPAAARPELTGWRRTFAALQHPNYRLWFLGQLVSQIGTWMQTTAQGFLVFELTRSTAYLGYVGSLLGALMLAALSHWGHRGRWLTIGMFAYPAMVLVFAGIRVLPLSLIALVGVGWGGMVTYNMANTLLQMHVSDAMRGRVMSMYSMVMFGGMPLGALWAGTLANSIGAPLTLAASALIALVFALFFWIRAPQLRQLT